MKNRDSLICINPAVKPSLILEMAVTLNFIHANVYLH